MNKPKPFEEETPELAEPLAKFCKENAGRSRFNRVEIDADKIEVGRNDPCSCGSNKKFKKCCINK